jgi:hypothetical protein
MLKSPQIMMFSALLYIWFRIESREFKKCMKFPDGDLYTENTQKLKEENCNFTVQISMSCSLQKSFKSLVVNDKGFMNKYANSTIFTVNSTVFSPKVIGIDIYTIYFIITKMMFSKTKYVRKISRPKH